MNSWIQRLLICLTAMQIGRSEVFAQQPKFGGRTPGTAVENPSATDNAQEWYRIEFDGKPVGHESLTTVPLASGNGVAGGTNRNIGLLRRIRDTRLKLRRFGTDVSVSAHLETVETSDGILQSWSLRRSGADGAAIERRGSWNSEKSGFDVFETISGVARRELLTSVVQPRSAIFPAWLSEASSGSARLWTAAVFFPETAAIVDVEIRLEGEQSLQKSDGSTIAVTRFDYWPTSNPEMRSSVFYDRDLSVVRVEQPLLGQTLRLERTDAATALGQESMESLDLQFSSVLPLKRAVTNIDKANSLRLKFSVADSEQIELPSSEFQTIERISSSEVLVTVIRPTFVPLSEADVSSVARKRQIDPSYTSASRWLTTENDDIKRMSIIAAGATSIPEDKCRRLTQHVFKHLKVSPFSTSMQPASAILKNMRGDCTEHAVLLATLMRAQGIPSRVAIGFVYVPNPASFAPHMWTEAFLDGKWIPFDSTRGPLGIGLTHVKVADSVLSDDIGSGTVLFVPLLSFLGRATVDVAPVEAGN